MNDFELHLPFQIDFGAVKIFLYKTHPQPRAQINNPEQQRRNQRDQQCIAVKTYSNLEHAGSKRCPCNSAKRLVTVVVVVLVSFKDQSCIKTKPFYSLFFFKVFRSQSASL